MQPMLKIKPPRLNYLLWQTIFVVTIVILISFVSIFLYRDHLRGFSTTTGTAVGGLLGGILLWLYDEIMKFERWAITLTENAIIVPEAWFRKKMFLLAGLDKQRTLVYNSENNLSNRIRYTFWLINGERTIVGKSFYGRSQVNALLEKVGFPKI